nr:E3 binding domain-containing protein [Propionibacteriales bacterium]
MAQIAIRMPKMSMTMTEGEVSEWFVGVGDTVSEGDVICEVLTDKVDMEVESPASGTISSIEIESGSVDVGTPIGYIEGDDSGGLGDLLSSIGDAASVPDPATQQEPTMTGSAPAPTTEPTSEPPTSEPTSEPPTSERAGGPVAAVPRARSLATDHGIDLANVDATGPDGLIVMADVRAVLPGSSQPSEVEAEPVPRGGTPAAMPSGTTSAASAKRTAQIRARVAAKMTASASVPQFTVWRDLVLDATGARRGEVSWTTVLLGAYAAALRGEPDLL